MFRDEDSAWVDVVDAWQWLPGGKELLWVSERDGWRHVWARLDRTARSGSSPGCLRHRSRSTAVDAKTGTLYFIASPGDATQRYLYRARLDGKGAPERVTPPNPPGRTPTRSRPTGAGRIHTFSTVDRPPVDSIWCGFPSHQTRSRPRGQPASSRRRPRRRSSPADGVLPVDIGGGVTLDGWMIKPRDFDPSKKYPLLMYVYGEPAGPTVERRWGGDRPLFHRVLADAGLRRGERGQPGHPVPEGAGLAKVDLRRSIGVLATRGPGRRRRALARDASVHRSRARGDLGLERRRLDDAEPDVPLSRRLQGRHGRRAGAGPAALRHDLPGALHGAARRRTPRATGTARRSTSRRD